MNNDIFLIAIVALSVVFVFRRQWVWEQDRMRYLNEPKPGRRAQIFDPLLLPIWLAVAPLLLVLLGSADSMGDHMMDLFVRTGIYYALILILLPLFRRIISARACATLWLLPSVMLMFPQVYFQNHRSRPLLIVSIPGWLINYLLPVWLIGTALVLAWHIYSHFTLRRHLLEGAVPIRDSHITELWESERKAAELKNPIELKYSPAAPSPMTIGLRQKSMVCLLPRTDYSMAELRLIFRHELRHVARGDTQTKLFSAVLTAACWPNPLAWIAARKAAEDLELSCDEIVLSAEDERTRKDYARLLIKSGCDSRGFSTCLSSAAKTLRHRLKCVVRPGRRLSGAWVLGLLTAALAFSGGWVSVSAAQGSMDDLVFRGEEPGSISRVYTCTRVVHSIFDRQDDYSEALYAWDEDALINYLGGLELQRLDSGIWDAGCSGYVLELFFNSESGVRFIELNDDILYTSSFIRGTGGTQRHIDYYKVTSPIDWDYIHSLLDYDAPNPDPNPVLPYMVFTVEPDVLDGEPAWMNGECLRLHDADGTREDPYANREEDGACYFHGADITALHFGFSYDPDSIYVRVEPLDGSEAYTLSREDLEESELGWTLPLLEESAIYHIGGSFSSHRSTVFEMEFHIHNIREGDQLE